MFCLYSVDGVVFCFYVLLMVWCFVLCSVGVVVFCFMFCWCSDVLLNILLMV